MRTQRAVDWPGFHNTRDLGGLPTRDGRRTLFGAFYQSATLELVTADGWRQAHAAGVRTVVDLRNDDEAGSSGPDPVGMTRLRVPLDGVEDVDLWRMLREERLDGTPSYYRPFLARRPDRAAAAVTALARSGPGAVLFHCGAGRDRTGLVTLLLLALADVEPEAIAQDYVLTAEPLRQLSALLGRPDDSSAVEAALADRGTTASDSVLAALDGFDAAEYLREAGVPDGDMQALRERLLG